MKKILLVLAMACFSIAGAKAQTTYGVKAGLNFAKIKMGGGGFSINSDATTSFYVTGYADLPVAGNLTLQPGISLQGKGGTIATGGFGKYKEIKEDLMFIEVPVNFAYSIPTGNVGNIIIGAGPYAGLGIRAKSTMGNLSESGSFSEAGLRRFAAGFNFSTGFKFSNGFLINGGYDLGLTNILKNSGNVSAKTRGFSAGIGYQF